MFIHHYSQKPRHGNNLNVHQQMNKEKVLLLLSRFSPVLLCVTPQTAAHQAPPSLGFSRQERWSGLPFPSPMHESEKWKWSRSVVSDSVWPHRLYTVHGILQARILEWVTFPFSRGPSQSRDRAQVSRIARSEEHTSELQSPCTEVCPWAAVLY